MAILVTGGSGFIGSNFILHSFSEDDEPLINIDKLTYAGNQNNLLAVLSQSAITHLRTPPLATHIS